MGFMGMMEMVEMVEMGAARDIHRTVRSFCTLLCMAQTEDLHTARFCENLIADSDCDLSGNTSGRLQQLYSSAVLYLDQIGNPRASKQDY